MVTKTTKGISVTVNTEYQPGYSSPGQYHYVFTYRILIKNNSNNTIKLLRRHWEIHDAAHTMRVVEGDGVIGQQPTLEPGEQHEYVSGCSLKSGIGKMTGYYTMEKLLDGKIIKVIIPEFTMVSPFKYN